MSRSASDDLASAPTEFIVTREYRRFTEFCRACRRDGYVGICHGPPGVGKTLSAREYTRWDLLEPRMPRQSEYLPLPAEIADCNAVLYTPSVTNTPRSIASDVKEMRLTFSRFVYEAAKSPGGPARMGGLPDACKLLIVDEADRLRFNSLEQVRDIFDKGRLGLVLIGMPGLEKRLARFPQLYSRVGFAHQFNPLCDEELEFILEHKWRELGLVLDNKNFTDAQAVAAITRIAGGNLRLLHRLFRQIERILTVNGMDVVSREVVEAARGCLVIGVQ